MKYSHACCAPVVLPIFTHRLHRQTGRRIDLNLVWSELPQSCAVLPILHPDILRCYCRQAQCGISPTLSRLSSTSQPSDSITLQTIWKTNFFE
jgi:hypothetical protein